MPHTVCAFLWLFVCASQQDTTEDPYTTTTLQQPSAKLLDENRPTTTVRSSDMRNRLPRSAPDALRYEPGVFVQQSAHGQGSAFIRGLTGQQTLLLFDGIRLNNSTYRQGPNQYFFTLDTRTLASIEVLRGGSSTAWGTDAIGGVINANPLQPYTHNEPLSPSFFLKATTADSERGGRFQLNTNTLFKHTRIQSVMGVGARKAGLLHGPAVLNIDRNTPYGDLPQVPRYKEYNPLLPWSEQPTLSTQLGTGFREITADMRTVITPINSTHTFTLAAYSYMQLDTPRTDQCPPPTAPYDQCLTYEKQFRHLVYGAWEHTANKWFARTRTTLSWQQQHEKKRLNLTAANVLHYGKDTVNTFGFTWKAQGHTWRLNPQWHMRLHYGADHYVDTIQSNAYHTYTDTRDTVQHTRGQYVQGSVAMYGGLFTEAFVRWKNTLVFQAGTRMAWNVLHAPSDPASGTQAIQRTWVPWVGHLGVRYQPFSFLAYSVHYDHSFRAPNLDDMTARQQTGPGFQFENPLLKPERAHTFDIGMHVRTRFFETDLWLFETLLYNSMIKVSQGFSQCPASTPQCQASWSRLQLQNAPSYSEIRGIEHSMRIVLPWHMHIRNTFTYTWSEGPRIGTVGYGGKGVALGERIPLSRTPPMNGTTEWSWQHPKGFYSAIATQWARAQTRLAVADYADGRIPKYGTPGFIVTHLRAGYTWNTQYKAYVVCENIFNQPYRFHGSSVNGAGRGLVVAVEGAFF